MPKISLSGPAELLTAIPFHLGFRPVRSVVALCFHDRRLGLVARLDAVPEGDALAVAEQTVPSLVRDRPTSVLLVGFDSDDGESRPLLDALRDALLSALGSSAVAERLVVHEGRWYGIDCECCRWPGAPLPVGSDVSALAGYVAVGGAVLASREELCRVIEPLAPGRHGHDVAAAAIERWRARVEETRPDTGAVTAPGGRRRSRRVDAGSGARRRVVGEVLRAWGALVSGELDEHLGARSGLRRAARDGSPGLSVRRLGALVGPLFDVELRDVIIAWLCPGALPLDVFPEGLVAHVRGVLGPAPFPRSPGLCELIGRDDASGAVVCDAIDSDVATDVPATPGDLPGDVPGDLSADPPAELLSEAWDDWQEAGATRALLARLEALCRLTPAVHAVPLLSVVASYAWWCGDGARASVAVDRALELDPAHRLSQLIRRSLDQGLRLRPAV